MAVITEPFVLAADVELTAVAEFDDDLRESLDSKPGDVALRRRRSRVVAKLVDATTADLLREFQTPRRIVDAVVQASRRLGVDREQLLRDSYRVLSDLIDDGYLLTEREADDALGPATLLQTGSVALGFTIVACVHALEDVEVYQARKADGEYVALKVAREPSGFGSDAVRNECALLRYLDGRAAPRLLRAGTLDGRPYAVMEWRRGVGVDIAAAKCRSQSSPRRIHSELAQLCTFIAAAYSKLHTAGVIHADVHPDNIVVDSDRSVTLLDFGASCRISQANAKEEGNPRIGVGFYLEPECAAAELLGKSLPAASTKGEQYGIAALLYELLTGEQYLEFKLTRSEALRQIVEDPPQPLATRSLGHWPALERTLFRGLAKHPDDRFSSMEEFAEALESAFASVPNETADAVPIAEPPQAPSPTLDRLIHQLRAVQSGIVPTLDEPPYCSVNFGAAGVAYALYRMAQLEHDPTLLASADIWCTWSCTRTKRRGAFDGFDGELTRATIGRASLFHTSPGVHLVRVLIAHAMDDRDGVRQGLRAFTRSAGVPTTQYDLALGRAGLLLGCALLVDTLSTSRYRAGRRALVALGAKLADELVDELGALPPIGAETRICNLGVAHGWAGLLYALLVWHQVARCPAPQSIVERLEELAALAEPVGRGVRWPWRYATKPGEVLEAHLQQDYMPGWCNGSAGMVFTLVAAHRAYPDRGFAELACRAAWYAWEEDVDGIFDLCCGAAGRAYALLAIYRLTGDRLWLDRSTQLHDAALGALDASVVTNASLYRGALGVALLSRELEHPELARMPLCELEGWSPSASA